MPFISLHNDAIIKEILIVAKINHVHLHQPINSGNRKCVSATIVVNKIISKLTVASHIPTNTIPLATIFSNKFLAAIFPFELEENAPILLFSGALEEKPITAMYMDARVDGHLIKLILDSGSAGSIITRQLMDQLGHRVDRAASARIITANGATKTLIGEIDDFPFEVNDIMTLIKVLVMEATQYQALVGNDWLSKVNATLDWNTQELQLTYQGQHIHVPATCGHFKTPPREKLLIELKEEKEKPIWEAYQVSWIDKEHNELPPILSWDDNNKRKGKQKEELTWKTDDLTWTDNDKTGNRKKTKKIKEKEKKKRPLKPPPLITPTLHHNNLPIIDPSLYALIVARNCRQWAHAVGTMRNIQWQLGFIAAHASLNALEDQNK
ncbi:hypothetical protein G9A89_023905 [Geosiphon pyriformis]|nr:hypothetical protein G9A89_023905 [Geosiphon pyriformis]